MIFNILGISLHIFHLTLSDTLDIILHLFIKLPNYLNYFWLPEVSKWWLLDPNSDTTFSNEGPVMCKLSIQIQIIDIFIEAIINKTENALHFSIALAFNCLPDFGIPWHGWFMRQSRSLKNNKIFGWQGWKSCPLCGVRCLIPIHCRFIHVDLKWKSLQIR